MADNSANSNDNQLKGSLRIPSGLNKPDPSTNPPDMFSSPVNYQSDNPQDSQIPNVPQEPQESIGTNLNEQVEAPEIQPQTEPQIAPPDIPSDLGNLNQYSPGRKSGLMKAVVAIVLILLLVGGIGTAAVLAAYEKIIIPNEKVQDYVSYTIINLPFMPKTPKFVLEKASRAHEDVRSAYVNASIATDSTSFLSSVGLSSFDMVIDGPMDFSDEENPKLKLNIKLTKEFDADVILLDNMVYGRINIIPAMVYAMLPVTIDPNNNPFLDRWVAYDISPLETNARDALKQNQPTNGTDTIVGERIKSMLNSRLLPKMKLSNETLDNRDMHKIDIKLNQNELQELEKDVAQILGGNGAYYDSMAVTPNQLSAVNDVTIELWIDKSEYHVRKAQMLFTILSSSYENSLKVLGAQTIIDTKSADTMTFAFTMTLDDLGRDFSDVITPPERSIPVEQFISEMNRYFDQQMRIPEDEEEVEGFDSFTEPPSINEEDADGFAQ